MSLDLDVDALDRARAPDAEMRAQTATPVDRRTAGTLAQLRAEYERTGALLIELGRRRAAFDDIEALLLAERGIREEVERLATQLKTDLATPRSRSATDERHEVMAHEVLPEPQADVASLLELAPIDGQQPTTAFVQPPRARTWRPNRAIAGALALMLSAVGSGVLTFAFWTVIARARGAATVGAASAEISTITFLAGVGSLNLINVFARFLPDAGAHARRFVLTSYAAAATAGLLVATGFLATSWSHGIVVGGTMGRIGFVALVVCVSVFMIQDGGLIGFGKSLWVPVENIAVGVGRLISLPLAALAVGGTVAAVAAWAGATVLAVIVVNAVIIGRLAIRHREQMSRLPPRPELTRFIAVESVTTAVSSSLSAFLPAIVEHVRGATAAGYFYLPWLIATTCSLLLMSVLISMVRELAATRDVDPSVITGQLRLVCAVVAAVVLVCCVDPTLVMSVLGSNFGRQAGTLLRWIGLSVPATAVALLFWSFCLLDRRPWPIFAMNISNAVLVIGGVMWIGRDAPIARVGLLYCAVQWAIAACTAVPLSRRLRRSLNPSMLEAYEAHT